MDNFFGIVEAFYSRFILRDLLAKVVPGSLLIIIISQRIIPVEITLGKISFLPGLLFISVSWVAGFAIQGVGEKLKLIKYHIDGAAANRYKSFLRQSGAQNNKDIERIVVIKETCGNTYVSLLMIFIFSVLKQLIIRDFNIDFSSLIYYSPEIFVFISLLSSLRYMHFEHVKRQDSLVKTFLPKER